MKLCFNCLLQGFCRRERIDLVTDEQLNNSEYLRDVRACAYNLGINDEDWRESLTVLYRDFRGWIANADGTEIFLAMQEFERPSIREWFHDFCCTPCPVHVTPRVRSEARERVRALATILTARFPDQARWWGIAANDNRPPE